MSVPLEDYDESYRNAQAVDSGEVPDGTYLCAINSCYPAESTTGKDMFKWMFTVLGPTSVGRKIFRNDVLTPEKLPWLKADFSKLGLKDMERLSDFYDRGGEIIGKVVEVRVQTKVDGENVYRNVFINKLVGEQSVTDDDIPF